MPDIQLDVIYDITPICQVHKEKTGEEIPGPIVYASVFGPMSIAVCEECFKANRESYNYMVAGFMGFLGGLHTKDDIREELHLYVDAILEYFDHSFEDLVKAVKAAEEDYNAYMLGEPD